MFEKNMQIAYLLDFYGDALDEHTREIMKAYYEDDLSLSEIADGESISRQGVRHIIKKGEEYLEFLEEKLHLCSRADAIGTLSGKLETVRDSLLKNKADFSLEISILDDVITTIKNKGI